MRCTGRHGSTPEQREIESTFLVDLSVRADLEPAARSDDLSSAVDLAALAATVREVVGGPSRVLLETVVVTIARTLLGAFFGARGGPRADPGGRAGGPRRGRRGHRSDARPHLMRVLSRPGLLVGLAYLGFAGLGVRSGLLGVAWPSMRADFDVPLDALGALLGPFAIGYMLGSFVSGRVLVRWNLGAVLAASSAGMAINLLGSAVAPAWWLLLALGLPGGLGTGLIDAGLNTYVANRQGPREMNWLHASWGVGVTLSPLMMTAAITSGLGWRWGFALSGLLLLALSGAYVATSRLWPSRADVTQLEPGGAANQAASMWQTLRLPVAWLSMLLFIAYTGVELGIGQWAFPLARRRSRPGDGRGGCRGRCVLGRA